MSILAYIALKDHDSTRRGDIFQVRLLGAKLGTKDRLKFALAIIDDDVLEARMEEEKLSLETQYPGLEVWPGIAYPYSVRNADNTLAKTSTRQVDLSGLDPAIVAEIDDPKKDSPILARGTFTIRSR